jgi:hypothetical protein
MLKILFCLTLLSSVAQAQDYYITVIHPSTGVVSQTIFPNKKACEEAADFIRLQIELLPDYKKVKSFCRPVKP